MKMHPTYQKITSDVGARNDTIKFFLSDPGEACIRLEKRIKKFARVLENTLGISHSASLKAFAVGFRFENWHSMSAHIKQHGDVSTEWLNKMKWSFFILESQFPFFKLQEKMIESVTSFAFRVAEHTGSNIKVILDNVCAKIFNSNDWAEALARDPMNITGQLFTVQREFDEVYFMPSKLCQSLYDELSALEPDYYAAEEESKEQKQARLDWALNTLKKQSEFYPALSIVLAEMVKQENFEPAKVIASTWIRSIDRDLPKDKAFKLHNMGANTFYYEILDSLIESSFFSGDYKKALAAARKSVRLSGDKESGDSYGHRYIIPIALIMNGDYAKACTSSNYEYEGTGIFSLTRAFGCFAMGRNNEFISYICETTLNSPGYKTFIYNDPDLPIPSSMRSHNHESDLYSYGRYLWEAYNEIPGLRRNCEHICSDPKFKEIETVLNQYNAILNETKEPDERGRIMDLIDDKTSKFCKEFSISHQILK